MCNAACITFGRSHLFGEEVIGKSVIEVGALDVNGSLRTIVENLHPMKYLGVDIANGPGVDEICDINDLMARYGKESFDVVISTEIIEHVRDWRRAVSNLKGILKPNGILLLTTRSRGFGYHGYPFDFWRYEVDDMRILFSDFSIIAIERDPEAPGVFVKARKPVPFSERDLRTHELFSIVRRKRCRNIQEFVLLFFKLKKMVRRVLSVLLPARVKASIMAMIFEKTEIS